MEEGTGRGWDAIATGKDSGEGTVRVVSGVAEGATTKVCRIVGVGGVCAALVHRYSENLGEGNESQEEVCSLECGVDHVV